MRQVVAIHGGDSFKTYDEYFAWLKNFELEDPTVPRGRGWRLLLGEVLGPEYQVISPRMPNHFNCKYAEWEVWFEKHVPYLTDGVLLVGHSQGAIFLAKYLATKDFPKKVGGTFLVAPPYDVADEGDLENFDVPLTKLAEQGGKIFIYQSKDDPVVVYSEFEKYQKAIPTATFRSLDGYGHFIGDEFPELIADIKSLG
jgi:uncharacterized protein